MNASHVLTVAEMQGRDLLRRRLALALLIGLPLSFYAATRISEDGFAFTAGGIGMSWSVAGAALFSALAGRRVDARLVLGGYRPSELLAGRVLLLGGLGLALGAGFALLMASVSHPVDTGALVLALVAVVLVAVPFGLAIAALVPRELEGTLLLIGVIGIEMSLSSTDALARVMPFNAAHRLLERAEGYPVVVRTQFGHAVAWALVLVAVAVVGWRRRARPLAPVAAVVAVAIALFTISWPTPHVSAAVVNAVDVGGALNVVAGPDALWLTLPDSHGNSAITRVDPTSGLVRPSPFQGYPDALVLSESGTFVTDLGRSRVVEIDENSGRELASLALPPRPDEVTVGAGSLWVSSIQAGVVSRVELSLAHVVSTIRVGHAPYFLVFASGWAWAGNHDDRTLSRIDPATNQVAATIPLGARPWRAAASNTGLWVTSRDDGVVLRVDPTGRITARVRVSRPDGVAAADDGSVWVATDGGRLVRIDGRTAQVRANVRVSAGSRSTSVAVAEDGSVWITDVGRGLLLKVDPTRVPG